MAALSFAYKLVQLEGFHKINGNDDDLRTSRTGGGPGLQRVQHVQHVVQYIFLTLLSQPNHVNLNTLSVCLRPVPVTAVTTSSFSFLCPGAVPWTLTPRRPDFQSELL